MRYQVGRDPGIGPAQLTCPNTDTDHSDQSLPVLSTQLFLEDGVVPPRASNYFGIPALSHLPMPPPSTTATIRTSRTLPGCCAGLS
jgi:hypothetical protein